MHPAALDETTLSQSCEVRRQRRSGPGGQHRNKVETAVVITHLPTGVRGEASERRSQEENRRRAVFRLRVNLALQVRQPVDLATYEPSERWLHRCPAGRIVVSAVHPDFPTLLAEALDVLEICDLEAKLAAQHLRCSSSQVVRLLQIEGLAIAQINRRRVAAGKPAYR